MKLFDTTSFYDNHRQKLNESFKNVMEKGKFIGGDIISNFEKMLMQYTGSKYCVTCGSGTDGITLALMALGVGPGDAVFTTSFSFVATAEPIKFLGATPIFCDIGPDCNIYPEHVEKRIQYVIAKTGLNPKAIVGANLFGLPADYNFLTAIARKYNLKIIEDACQSFGSTFLGLKSCALADISVTSFFPTKNLGGIGDGGAVFTDDHLYAKTIHSIANHGKGLNKYNNVRIGMNSRLDVLNAAFLSFKLKFIDETITIKQDILTEIYNNTNISVGELITHNPYTLPILVNNRKNFIEKLKERGIPFGIYYETPLTLQPVFLKEPCDHSRMTIAEFISRTIINLPLHEYLNGSDVNRIINAINER